MGLYSMKTPPLTKEQRLKWLLYAVVGIMKILCAATSAGLLIALGIRKDPIIGGESKIVRVVSIVSICVVVLLLLTSGFMDGLVFFSTMSHEEVVATMGVSRDGHINTTRFFASTFSSRHRLQTWFNRCALIGAVLLSANMSPPNRTWISKKCAVNLDSPCSPESIAVPFGTIFLVNIAGGVWAWLLAYLWCGKTFKLYGFSSFIRLVLGVYTIGIVDGFLASVHTFLSGDESDLKVFDFEQRVQAALLFSVTTINGMVAGIILVVGGSASMFASWRRSKIWMSMDAVASPLQALLLACTCTTTVWAKEMARSFCRLSDRYSLDLTEQASQNICTAFRDTYKTSASFWVLIAGTLFTVGNSVFSALCVLAPAWFTPHEWIIAEELMMSELRENRRLKSRS